ncbi:hypothetical protein Pmani_000803 [Petrolisthes manimaculis]|uniref:Sushi domain-containing protein n=1 Tax=Petrolisthes manimaculis TaxID=1843537 RepID=A0AAE1QP51_9EUCA|nr:hypothetical protein Pmani_000803 [Petrolisthes manimaculis]
MDWKCYVLLCITLTSGVIVDVGAQCPSLPSGAPGLRYENVTLNTYLVWCEESNQTLDNHYSRHLDLLTCNADGQWFPDAPTECTVQDLASQPAQPCSSDPVDPDSVVVVKDIFNGTTSSELVGKIYVCEDNMEWLSGGEARITQCLRGSWTKVLDECTPKSCLVVRDCHDVADLHTDNGTYNVIPTGKLKNEHTEMQCEFLGPEEGVWSNVLYRDGAMTMLLTVDPSGDPDTGDFFIGLNNLAALSREVNGTVRPLVFQFIFTENNGNQHHATYDNVTIGPAPNYTLQSLGNFHGDAGNAMDVCLGQDYDSNTFWWKSTSGLTPTTNSKWQSQQGGTITFSEIQLRIRPRTYDQNLSCPGLNYNAEGSNWEGYVPISRAPGAVITYNCTGGFFYKEGVDVEADFHPATDNTTCYHFSPAPATGGIIQAARECQKKRAFLAVITSSNLPWELAVSSEYYFIGHMLVFTTQKWSQLKSESQIHFQCFVKINEVQCVLAKQGTYQNHNCMDPSHHYLCQILGTCPPNYEEHRGKCYKYVNTGNNDPQKSCTEDGGTLAYPETLDDLRSVESYYKAKGGSSGTVLLGLNNASGNWTAGNRFNPTSDITDLATNTTASDSQYWRTLSIDTSTASLPSFIPVDMMTMSTTNEYICQYPSPTACFTDPPQLTVNMTNCSANSGMGYGVEKCYECFPGYFLYGNASAPTMQSSKCIGVLGEWFPKDIVDCLPAEVCGEVPVPTTPGTTNSSDGTNIRYLNATMSFTCPENMTTANKIPVQNITCIEDGAGLYKFDPETVLDCNVCEDEPPAVGNATLPDHNNNTIYYVNDSTPATCVEGHVFAVGVATMDLNCTQNSWTELTACYGACVMDPPIAGNNTVRENLTDIAFGTEMTYNCSDGFYIPPDQDSSDLVNSIVVKCNTSHQWDPPQPINCVKVCVNMDPASPSNGNSSWDNVTRIVDTEVELTCPANHTFTNLSTTLTLKCEESGNWTQVDQDLIKCLMPCPDTTLPSIPSNATMEGPEAPPYWVGDAVNFTCGPGQESQKQETQLNIECVVDDGWINFDSNFACFNACQKNPYPVDLPAYSDWNNLTRIVGTKVMYSCPSGMVFANLSSTVEVECEEMTRNWTTIDPEMLICRTACPDTTLPSIPSNATMEGPEAPPYWVGDAVNFTCGPGQESKKQETQLNIECVVDDGWINFDSNFACFNACQKNPYPVDLPAYSDWNNLTRIVGTKVMYSCPSGMVFANLSSTVEVECEEMTRNWTTIDPEMLICRTECETAPPPNPANTTSSYESPYWQEEPLIFSCPYGYASPTGGISFTITCLSNNTWTPIDPAFECIDGCSNAPPYPPGVATSTDRSVQTRGTMVTYNCEFGFEDGPMTHTSTCTEDGIWRPGAFHRCDDSNMNLENNPFGSLSILGLTGNISEVAQGL